MLKHEKNKDICFLSKEIRFCFCSLKFHFVGAVYQSADLFFSGMLVQALHPALRDVDFLIWTSSQMDNRLWYKDRVWHLVESEVSVSLSHQGQQAEPTLSVACPGAVGLHLRHKWPCAAAHEHFFFFFFFALRGGFPQVILRYKYSLEY